MNEHAMHNVFVKSISVVGAAGFDIALLFSGAPEIVAHHSHDGMLYQLLHEGMRLDDLRRLQIQSTWCSSSRGSKRASRKLEHGIRRILRDIDRYLDTRSTVLSSYSTPLDAFR